MDKTIYTSPIIVWVVKSRQLWKTEHAIW